jgi:hypothetical protein
LNCLPLICLHFIINNLKLFIFYDQKRLRKELALPLQRDYLKISEKVAGKARRSFLLRQESSFIKAFLDSRWRGSDQEKIGLYRDHIKNLKEGEWIPLPLPLMAW